MPGQTTFLLFVSIFAGRTTMRAPLLPPVLLQVALLGTRPVREVAPFPSFFSFLSGDPSSSLFFFESPMSLVFSPAQGRLDKNLGPFLSFPFFFPLYEGDLKEKGGPRVPLFFCVNLSSSPLETQASFFFLPGMDGHERLVPPFSSFSSQ